MLPDERESMAQKSKAEALYDVQFFPLLHFELIFLYQIVSKHIHISLKMNLPKWLILLVISYI
jgi:hypothetical protein